MSDVAIEPDDYADESDADDLSIAIIGVAGRVPGADDMRAFWQNLVDGNELVTHFSRDELKDAGVPSSRLDNPRYVRSSPVLKRHPGLFDAAFFGYTPREARLTDPQHRLFLECAWEALEHAGYDADRCDMPVGVFGGSAMNTYLMFSGLIPDFYDEYFPILLGNDNSYLATRVSFKLNLNGPSMTVQTACSSSLVAVHMACQSLLNEECDLALAGGVSVRVPYKVGYQHQEGSVASPDGHCRTFDAKAAGTLFGSGAGVVVLKRLTDAIADRDSVLAVVRGTAVNNDGASKLDFTAPSLGAQADVISQALASAGVSADDISYVEAHGTGTFLGDPIEVAALTRAFRKDTDRSSYCALGSVKTNIGHLDAAAGVIGLIKVALSLDKKQIPASLHFEKPNPQIDFDNSPFFVNAKTCPWLSTSGRSRLAGISSLGIGGTNTHAVLEEVRSPTVSSASRDWQLLLLSARSEAALKAAGSNLAEHLENEPDQPLADVAYTLQVGRKRFDHRQMVVCADRDEAIARLAGRRPGAVSAKVQEAAPSIAFMFPGSGAQYCNMALDLYRQEVVFRDEIERCFSLIAPHLESDLKSVIYPGDEPSKEVIADLQKPTHTFTSLFVVEYAMAKLLMSWGITPGAMIGHSVGEYTAACLSGVVSLKDALALVALRGRLFETLPEGSMASVPLPADEVEALLGEDLSIAAVNRTDLCVVSGPIAAVDALRATLAQRGVETARVHASFAPHSKLVEPILDEFRAFLETITFGTPEIPLVSNLTGDFVEPERVTVPDYWVRHLRETVHFAGGIGQLIKDPRRALIEVGPGQTLATLARQHPGKSKGQLIACTTRHPRQDTADHAVFLNTLGKLWLAGTDVDWDGFYASEERRRVPLPAYPFEREMYWMETGVDGLRSEQSRQPSVSDQKETVQEEALVAQAEIRVEPMDGERSLLGQLKMMLHDVSGIEIANIDPEATFAELGIDSLMMLQVTAALGRDFDIRIGPRELFQETPSLVLLAASIEKASPERWGARGTISLPESRRPVEARHPSPREDTIARLKKIVEDITGHDAATVDPDASFIELGIDSLMIIQVSARIQKEFNTALDLNDLFDKARTLNVLAGHIGDTDASIGGGTQPPIALRQKVASITAPIRDDEANVARKADITEWFYQPSWIRSPLAPVDSSSRTSTWLLFADDRDIHAKLAETLRKQGQIVVTITRGDRFEKRDDDQFSIRPDVSEDYARLVSALSEAGGSFTHIVHGWTYESTASKGGVDNSFDVSDAGFFSLLYLAQALPAADIRLFILTSALFSVNGSGPIDPLKATLLGPCRVIPKEMPRVHCRLIDLPVEDDQSPDEDLTAHLVAEFGQATTAQVVAYRDGERWLQTFSQARPADATTVGAAPGLKKSGIYLITGGFGDLGGLITNHLARAYQARLVLVGRTELPPREEWEARTGSSAHGDPIASRIGQILDLEALGAEVLTVSADVADRMQMDQAIQQTIARFGRFDGVIHAAGVLNDGIIPFKTRRDVEASFAAKITGTLVIEAVTKHLDLDFVALFSSTHAILAPPGQIAHSAANSFLDQFAQSRFDGAPRRYLTINWPLWHKVSLVGVDGGPWLQEARANGIGSADGIKAFEHALRCPSPQVILSPNNFADAITVFNRLSDSNRSQVDQSTPSPLVEAPAARQTSLDRSAEVDQDRPIVRSATSDDIEKILSLLGEAFPDIIPDSWRQIFDYSWDPQRPNLGFVLVDGDDLVGFVGTIYAERDIDGRREKFCNGSAWFVRPSHRSHSMDLLLTFVSQPGYTITALTPNSISGSIMEAMGFQILEQSVRFLPPLFQAHTLLRGAGLRILTKTEEMKPHLSASDLKILRDHEPYACRHYLVLSKEGPCYIVTRYRATYGIRSSEILYTSDPAVMVRYLEWIKLRILFSEKAFCLISDERMFGGHFPLSLKRSRLRYFISDTLEAAQIDHLYTEYVVVPEIGQSRLPTRAKRARVA